MRKNATNELRRTIVFRGGYDECRVLFVARGVGYFEDGLRVAAADEDVPLELLDPRIDGRYVTRYVTAPQQTVPVKQKGKATHPSRMNLHFCWSSSRRLVHRLTEAPFPL